MRGPIFSPVLWTGMLGQVNRKQLATAICDCANIGVIFLPHNTNYIQPFHDKKKKHLFNSLNSLPRKGATCYR